MLRDLRTLWRSSGYGSSRSSSCIVCILLWSLWTTAQCVRIRHNQERPMTKRRVAFREGDIILGALFPMHRKPSHEAAFTRQCGEIWEQYGIHRIEAFMKTLDEINQNPEILPEVRLGCDIRDSCWYPPVALEQSIDFIKNSIASLDRLHTGANSTNSKECSNKDGGKPIAGLIGPGSSSVTIQVQNLLSLFNIPQIGYSATSKDLSDKSLYKYFLRVVPSDKLQARALVDVVHHFNWTYISTIYTEGNYGFSGMTDFRKMAENEDICIAVADSVNSGDTADRFDDVIEHLLEEPDARVVVCFCEGMTVQALINATSRKGVQGKFLFIGSDGWAVRPDVVANQEEAATGGISIKLHSPQVVEFDRYYFSLKPMGPNQNTHNPWFREFWQERFKCRLPNGDDINYRFQKPCTGREDVSVGYNQDPKLSFVINAIYSMAYALDSMHKDLCKDRYGGLCAAMRPVNGSLFREYLLNVSFKTYSQDELFFDRNGDPPARYDLMNFQKFTGNNGSVVYDYRKIGGWFDGNLTMEKSAIFWPNPGQHHGAPMVESVCSKPCEKGKIKVLKGSQCCWTCHECEENEIVLDTKTCKQCQKGWWPNEDLTACVMIDIEHIEWDDTEAIIAIAVACIGVIGTLWIALVFIRHNNTAVVKASTRELMYIILLGIVTSYLTSFPLVAKPSLMSCYLTRILPGLSFSLIYGALVTKTNRIARILAGSKKKIMTRKPRFMSASAQVVITCLIIGVECAIITVMLILEPADSVLVYPSKFKVKLACNATTIGIIVPLGFDTLLIISCTLYAIKTRNLPENFNEAKFIGFTMYTTCVIWVAFVPIYFGSDNKVITMCMAISLSATVALVLLFFPKVYIIVCKPEKNNRSAFTTSKDVRCHIGSTSGRSYSGSDSIDRSQDLSSDCSDCDEYTQSVLDSNGLYSEHIVTHRGISVCPWRTGNLATRLHSVSPHSSSIERNPPQMLLAPWDEKSFENAAIAIYRQRSFFTRWKHKSSIRRPGGAGYSANPSRHYNNSATHPTSSNSALRGVIEAPSSSSRGRRQGGHSLGPVGGGRIAMQTNGARSHPPSPRHLEKIATTESDYLREDLSLSGRSSTRACYSITDSGVQTDEELLYPLVGTLRRRVFSQSGSSQRKVSQSSISSRDSQSTKPRKPPFNVTAYQDIRAGCSDQDLLPSSVEQRLGLLSASPATNEQLPLLSSADHSPMLSCSEHFLCDSTSEETLSDREFCDPLEDDIDNVLSGVGSDGDSSLASLCISDFELPGQSDNKQLSKDRLPIMHLSLQSSAISNRPKPTIAPVSPLDRASSSCPQKPPSSSTVRPSRPTAAGQDGVFRARTSPTSPTSPASPNQMSIPGHHIPQIHIDEASPSEPRSSGSVLENTRDAGATTAAAAAAAARPAGSKRSSLDGQAESRRSSASSTVASTSSGSTEWLSRSASADEVSLQSLGHQQKQPKHRGSDSDSSVSRFQQYLRTRGLNLDLTSVQSSNV